MTFFKINNFSKNVFSQGGEDGIIEYIIDTSKKPVFKNSVEFGAHDGSLDSNTYNLYLNHSFNSLLIEADSYKVSEIDEKYIDKSRLNIINKYVKIKGVDSIDSIINKNYLFKHDEIGVLSIDIDSYDYHILKNLQCKPQIIIIEFNNSIPGHIDYADPEEEVFLRCSAKAIEKLAIKKGYKVVCCTVTNCILLREDCFNHKKHPNMPVEFLLDYEGMKKSNDLLYTIIHSQMYSTYPLSTKPLNKIDKLYFKFSRLLMSFLNFRNEKYIEPSQLIKKKLEKSSIYF